MENLNRREFVSLLSVAALEVREFRALAIRRDNAQGPR